MRPPGLKKGQHATYGQALLGLGGNMRARGLIVSDALVEWVEAVVELEDRVATLDEELLQLRARMLEAKRLLTSALGASPTFGGELHRQVIAFLDDSKEPLP